ncbi:hypothetical protein QBK93_30900 [Rhizobium leguminosarum]|uniref:hypothetical protein n=1 Tax=Rhizobium leguminosarum TaxID=384 RepID=UPI0024A7ACB8|nr:hypothetical protein [Rhizobium leguminosarum]MDI5929054.1 hypothetical protein [Rhizobium leguminosarum]
MGMLVTITARSMHVEKCLMLSNIFPATGAPSPSPSFAFFRSVNLLTVQSPLLRVFT